MSKKKNKKLHDISDAVQNTLDDILNSDDMIVNDDFDNDMVDNTDDLPKMKMTKDHNYAKMKGEAEEKAKKTINNLLRFYLSEDFIEQDEYVKAKMRIEQMTLSSLIFQMEAGEKAIITLLEKIDSGDMQARMFEVLGTLQKSMLDVIKSQTMYLVAAEESAKKLSRDIDYFKNKQLPGSNKGQIESGNKHRGQKELMKNIQSEINPNEIDDENIEEIDYEEDDS